MPVTSGFSGFPHFTQRLLLTTSTYSFYFIFFYAKRERIFRKRTHGVWKRWVQICFYFLLNYKKKVVILFWYFSSLKSTREEKYLYDSSLSEFFSLVRKERKGQKEECFDSRLGDADTHASHMCQSLFWTPSVASRRPVRTHFPDRPAIAEPRLQVRNAQAPTRIHCCAMSGYGEPRGSDLGAGLGANIARWGLLL